jgi:hypothetical protein
MLTEHFTVGAQREKMPKNRGESVNTVGQLCDVYPRRLQTMEEQGAEVPKKACHSLLTHIYRNIFFLEV